MSDVSTFEDHTLRFECLIWIPSIIGAGDPPECVDDLIESLTWASPSPLLAKLPWLQRFLNEIVEADHLSDHDARELFCGYLWDHQRIGFFAQVARPVHKYRADCSSAFYSWGHYKTQWLYGETIEAVTAEAATWAAERERIRDDNGMMLWGYYP